MPAIKTQQAESFLAKGDRSISTILIYGPDAGLVSERSGLAARTWSKLEDPPGEILRIDEADLESDPDRLSVELMTVSMFGGRRVVRTSTGRRINVNLLKPLVSEGPLAGVLIVEAGNLKGSDALRTLFEKAKHAAAIACYPDEARDLGAVIDAELAAAQLKITADAREALVARLGADRVMSRSEVEKLAIYCAGRSGPVQVEDVEAIIGDASELAIDRIVQAAAGGAGRQAVDELTRALSAGESAQGVILALQRHFLRLHLVRAQADAGRSASDVLNAIRPPLHFRQRDALLAHLRVWNAPALTRALDLIAAAAKSARQASAMEDMIAERLVLSLVQIRRS